ncbi:MAG TPA: glycosyltransferase family 39 protein [Planctomycetota bacterium]|nr:glycosyltransferase family 39 protein [Planctomycetota bacterium]
MRASRNAAILCAIVLGGLALRAYNLGGESLWFDEGITAFTSRMAVPDLLRTCAATDHVPAYYLALKGWCAAFGRSEAALRSLSALFGVLSLLLMYQIGATLFRARVGLLAALLMALSVFHIRHAQEARMYSLLLVASMTSMCFFLRVLAGPRRWDSLGYVLSTALVMYIHPYGITTVATQNAFFLTELLVCRTDRRVSLKHWVLLQAAVVALYAPWIPTVCTQAARAASSKLHLHVRDPIWLVAGHTLAVFSGYFVPLLALLLVLSVLSVVRVERTQGKVAWRRLFLSLEDSRWSVRVADLRSNYLAAVWLVMPWVVVATAGLVLAPIFEFRCAIASASGFYLLAANGLASLRSKRAWWVVLLGVVALHVPPLWRYYTVVGKEPWREVVGHVDAHARPGDLVLLNCPDLKPLLFDYYTTRTDLVAMAFPRPDSDLLHSRSEVTAEDAEELGPLVEKHARIWVIISHYGKDAFRITDALSKLCEKREFKEWRPPSQAGHASAIYLYMFERKPGPAR